MSENWAEAIADRMAGTGPPLKGRLLLLGAADTGKTTLLNALASRLAKSQPVALVDADIGQSHIGPPTTVGWTLIERRVGLAPPQSFGEPTRLDAQDIAIGVVEHWRQEKAKGTIRAPELDVQRVRCLTIGDARIAAPFGWS
jgi:GTPase SAR1 family protein